MAAVFLSMRAPNPASKLLERLLFKPARTFAPPSSVFCRSFNANAQTTEGDADDDLRRRVRYGPGDAFDPLRPTRTLMDQMLNLPMSSRGVTEVHGQGWDAYEDADALQLVIDMPGLGKEHVMVSAENDMLIIRGEGEGGEEIIRRYSNRIGLPGKIYKVDGIKAEIKYGVLKVTVPKKVKEGERKDVQIE